MQTVDKVRQYKYSTQYGMAKDLKEKNSTYQFFFRHLYLRSKQVIIIFFLNQYLFIFKVVEYKYSKRVFFIMISDDNNNKEASVLPKS